MSLTKFTGATNWIRSLINKPTKPASELKEDFDKAGDLIKTYINETLTEEIDTELGTKANSSSVYTKSEIDSQLEEKADSSSVYTKAQADEKYKSNGDIVVVSANFTAFGGRDDASVDFPAGFNAENCIVIGVCGKNVGGAITTIPYVVFDTEKSKVPVAGVQLTTSIQIIRNGNEIEKVFVTLMKVS